MDQALHTPPGLLAPDEGPAVEVINADGAGRVVLVCEHAASRIPAALGDLGLDAEARAEHIAWDPGALEVARTMSRALDAPLVAARFSRLVYDCNRPPEAAGATPAKSERFEVPGNRAIAPAERAARIAEIYRPFESQLAATIDALAARGRHPALVTVHSFTPVYLGAPREVELGVLHDADSRLADWLLTRVAAATGLRSERNAPYGPEHGVTHTLKEHAMPRGMLNVMLEIRSDLVAEAPRRERIAAALAALLRPAVHELSEPQE